MNANWKIGDLIKLTWTDCPGCFDVLQIIKEEPESQYNCERVWCTFISKASYRVRDKHEDVWISKGEILDWPNGTLSVISDEKEKLATILSVK